MSFIGATVYRIHSYIREIGIKRKFKNNIKKYPPVIVYQMGKVGSMSIYESLKKEYKGIVLHRHVLNEPADWQAHIILEHALVYKRPLKLISLTREPIGRNISAFFQNFEKITGVRPQDSMFSDDDLSNFFFNNPKTDNESPLLWFDENIKKEFGIDVYKTPFDKKEGWAIIKRSNIDLLLMKSEISDKTKEELIRNYIYPEFALRHANISENKDYAAMYSRFRNHVLFPKEYLDTYLQSAATKHFYLDEEIAQFYKKWATQATN